MIGSKLGREKLKVHRDVPTHIVTFELIFVRWSIGRYKTYVISLQEHTSKALLRINRLLFNYLSATASTAATSTTSDATRIRPLWLVIRLMLRLLLLLLLLLHVLLLLHPHLLLLVQRLLLVHCLLLHIRRLLLLRRRRLRRLLRRLW